MIHYQSRILAIAIGLTAGCAAELSDLAGTGDGMYARMATPMGTIETLEEAFRSRKCELLAAVYDPALDSGDTHPGDAGDRSDFEVTVGAFEEMCATAETVSVSFSPRVVDMGRQVGFPASEGYVTVLADSMSFEVYSPQREECCRHLVSTGRRMLFVLRQDDLDREPVWRIVHERDMGRE